MERALTITTNRRMQGDSARILRKLSQVKLAMSSATEQEALSLMERAEFLRAGLNDRSSAAEVVEKEWDDLVCGYYR